MEGNEKWKGIGGKKLNEELKKKEEKKQKQ